MSVSAVWNPELFEIGRTHKTGMRVTEVPKFAREVLAGGEGMDVDEEVESATREAESGELAIFIGFGGSRVTEKNRRNMLRSAFAQDKSGGLFAYVELQNEREVDEKLWTGIGKCRVTRLHEHKAVLITNSEEVEKSVRLRNKGSLRESYCEA